MDELFQHPWLTQSGYGEWLERTVLASMKQVSATIATDSPPTWIVTLAETSLNYQAYTTLTVFDTAMISILGDAHDGPLSCDLDETQSKRLMAILKNCEQKSFASQVPNIMDGLLAVVTVVNGKESWCAFSEINLNDPTPTLTDVGKSIARLIRSFHRELWSHPDIS